MQNEGMNAWQIKSYFLSTFNRSYCWFLNFKKIMMHEIYEKKKNKQNKTLLKCKMKVIVWNEEIKVK